MNTLLIYMLKSAFYMAAFYLVYALLLSKDTMCSRNRYFILISLVSSLILPIITLKLQNPIYIPVFGKILSEVNITEEATASSYTQGLSLDLVKTLFFIYITGAALFLTKLIADLIKLGVLIRTERQKDYNIIRFSELNTAGFSAFGKVFINSQLTEEDAASIIRHEQNHLDHSHFSDIIFIEIIKVFQWFNPFIYLFDRSLRSVHEFQADEGCLRSGVPVINYQKLLMNQVFRSKEFSITNSFSNPTLIKKRMIMMTKKRSKAMANLKILLVLPALILLLISFSNCTDKKNTDKVIKEVDLASIDKTETLKEADIISDDEIAPFLVVEEMPMFPGGENTLFKFITESLKYPESAKANGIQGRVTVRFCVTEIGTVNKVTVLKGVNPDLDAEAIRVISSLPQFKPGKQGGKPVPVWMLCPITFALNVKEGPNLIPPPPTPPPPPTTDK